MTDIPKITKWYHVVLLVLIMSMGAGLALAQDPKTTKESVKYMRYNDLTVDPDVFKVLEVTLASNSAEIKADGCKTGTNKTLEKAKLIDAGDKKCPDTPGTVGPFVHVVSGKVEKVIGSEVTISYEVKDSAEAKKTITLPRDLIANKGEIKPGSEVVFYPIGLSSGSNIVKDFKVFEKQVGTSPPKAIGKMMIGVQMK